MRLLLDTQILLWSLIWPQRLPKQARTLILDDVNRLMFSTISVAEIAIKRALGRSDFPVDPQTVRTTLLANDYEELVLTGEHACRLADLPPVHRDPFDRLLIAQAQSEGLVFVTADAALAGYGGRVMVV